MLHKLTSGFAAFVVFVIVRLQIVFMISELSTVDVDVDVEKSNIVESLDSNNDDEKLAPFSVRLHLIRHGETHANVQNLVLGQGDSPLTENGLAVARVAASSDIVNGRKVRYWRAYCSDLYRAHRTARIVLGLDLGHRAGETNGPSDIGLIIDARLRELGKGAREGYEKSLSYEEAMAARLSEADVTKNGGEIQIPLLESIDEAWERIQDWIDSVIKEASHDYYHYSNGINKNENGIECNSNSNEFDSQNKTHRIYNVFALSHSALIRTMIHKMVDSQLPSNHAKTKEGSLRIPNLSRTIIDIRPYQSASLRGRNGDGGRFKWIPTLVLLTDVSHLNNASPNGPLYL